MTQTTKSAAGATGTVRLHRVLTAKPEKVYRAFVEADGMAKWLPPKGFTAKVHHMDSKVGGTFRMAFTNFSAGYRRCGRMQSRIARLCNMSSTSG